MLSTVLLGEADILTGQVLAPRSPPDSLASFVGVQVPKEQWIVKGICAYVPQVSEKLSICTSCYSKPIPFLQAAWLRNASIRGQFCDWARHAFPKYLTKITSSSIYRSMKNDTR
jgi:hypothetical protein